MQGLSTLVRSCCRRDYRPDARISRSVVGYGSGVLRPLSFVSLTSQNRKLTFDSSRRNLTSGTLSDIAAGSAVRRIGIGTTSGLKSFWVVLMRSRRHGESAGSCLRPFVVSASLLKALRCLNEIVQFMEKIDGVVWVERRE